VKTQTEKQKVVTVYGRREQQTTIPELM